MKPDRLAQMERAEAGLQRRIEYVRLVTKFPKNSLKISEPTDNCTTVSYIKEIKIER